MKIEKFGKIYEDENGLLVIDSFHFDAEGHPPTMEMVIGAIKQRLDDEHKEIGKGSTTCFFNLNN